MGRVQSACADSGEVGNQGRREVCVCADRVTTGVGRRLIAGSDVGAARAGGGAGVTEVDGGEQDGDAAAGQVVGQADGRRCRRGAAGSREEMGG